MHAVSSLHLLPGRYVLLRPLQVRGRMLLENNGEHMIIAFHLKYHVIFYCTGGDMT